METIRVRSGEIEQISESKSVDICCMEETKFRGKSVKIIKGNSARYSLFWIGYKEGLGDAGIFVAEENK